MTDDVATNEMGKRFKCNTCGAEVLCTKAGAGRVACCGVPMEVLKPKALPSSD
ncbi:MAG: desulfoferrodoxin [Dehalococcoidia bacterium]|nr:desulfoferrodoxin [Dehalococcoidia bacterium]